MGKLARQGNNPGEGYMHQSCEDLWGGYPILPYVHYYRDYYDTGSKMRLLREIEEWMKE